MTDAATALELMQTIEGCSIHAASSAVYHGWPMAVIGLSVPSLLQFEL